MVVGEVVRIRIRVEVDGLVEREHVFVGIGIDEVRTSDAHVVGRGAADVARDANLLLVGVDGQAGVGVEDDIGHRRTHRFAADACERAVRVVVLVQVGGLGGGDEERSIDHAEVDVVDEVVGDGHLGAAEQAHTALEQRVLGVVEGADVDEPVGAVLAHRVQVIPRRLQQQALLVARQAAAHHEAIRRPVDEVLHEQQRVVHVLGEGRGGKVEEHLVAPAAAGPLEQHDVGGAGALHVAVGVVLRRVVDHVHDDGHVAERVRRDVAHVEYDAQVVVAAVLARKEEQHVVVVGDDDRLGIGSR